MYMGKRLFIMSPPVTALFMQKMIQGFIPVKDPGISIPEQIL
jgi:hypothetical protein